MYTENTKLNKDVNCILRFPSFNRLEDHQQLIHNVLPVVKKVC